jgi:Domain of unknown function (DUF4386)
MGSTLPDIPRRTIAKVAGLFYLLYIVTFASSSFIQSRSVRWANAGTNTNLIPSESLFRVGFTTEIISVVFFLLAAWSLYVLLKPVNQSLALLFLLVNLAGVAVECGSALIHLGALPLAHGSDYSTAFTAAQAQALAILLLKLSGSGSIITALLYGVWLFPLGWLVIKSGFLPRILGVLLLLDGSSLVICFVQLCLFPSYQKYTYPLYPIMFIAEVGLSLYLLIKGV